MLRPEHATGTRTDGNTTGEDAVGALIRTVGGSSGRDVNKRAVCEELGYSWEQLPEDKEEKEEVDDWPHVLPSCLYYLKLELVGELIDCGSHEVALCKVINMVSLQEETDHGATELDSLSTRKLREMSIISELGRVIPLE